MSRHFFIRFSVNLCSDCSDRNLWRQGRLPRPEDFSKALYTLDCGQNDLHFGITSMGDEEKAVASIPSLINQFALAIEVLSLSVLYIYTRPRAHRGF